MVSVIDEKCLFSHRAFKPQGLASFSTKCPSLGIILVYVHVYQRTCKGLFKRSQHVGPTSSNIVGCDMLASFEHYVG